MQIVQVRQQVAPPDRSCTCEPIVQQLVEVTLCIEIFQPREETEQPAHLTVRSNAVGHRAR